MSGLRAQLSWLLKGRGDTHAVLERLTADLQALQHKVDLIDRRVSELASTAETLATRQLDGFDAVRESLVEAVDDLVGRIEAVRATVHP